MISPISKLLSSSLSKNDNNNRIVYSTSKEKKTDDGKSFIEVKKNTSFSFHTQLSIFFDFIKDKEGRKSIDNITASSSSTSPLPNNNYSNFSPSCFATVVEKNNGHQRFQRIIICDDYLSSTLNQQSQQQQQQEKEFDTSTTTTTTSIKTNSSSWSSSSSSDDDDNDHNNIQRGKSSPLFSKSDDELFIEAIAQGNYQILDHLINNQELIPTKQLFIDYLKSIYNEYKYLDFKLSILQIDILPPPTPTPSSSFSHSLSSFSTSSFQTKKESESKPRSRLSSIELVDKEEEEETEKKDIVESSPPLLTISKENKEEEKEKKDGGKVFSNNRHLCGDHFNRTQPTYRSSIPSGIPPFYSMGRLLINHFGDSSVIVCSLTGEILFSTLRTKYLPKKESPSLFISPTPIVGFPPSLSSSSSSTSFSTPCIQHNNACCCRCTACNQLVDNICIGDLYIEGENIHSTEFISFPPSSSEEEEQKGGLFTTTKSIQTAKIETYAMTYDVPLSQPCFVISGNRFLTEMFFDPYAINISRIRFENAIFCGQIKSGSRDEVSEDLKTYLNVEKIQKNLTKAALKLFTDNLTSSQFPFLSLCSPSMLTFLKEFPFIDLNLNILSISPSNISSEACHIL